MVLQIHEAESNRFIPLTVSGAIENLQQGTQIAINPHTRITQGLVFGGPCDGEVGVVREEIHGLMDPKEVLVVRCTRNNCAAAFFP